jgi:F-type H+-transporting ATPase subunit epsilon
MGFAVQLVTPEAALFSGDATAVILRTSVGDLTILDGHTDLVGDVAPVVARIERDGDTTVAFCVHGGFIETLTAPGVAAGIVEGASAEARSTLVRMLAGVAEPVDSIDVPRAEAARAAAASALSELAARDDDDEAHIERRAAEAALARAELRLSAVGASTAS